MCRVAFWGMGWRQCWQSTDTDFWARAAVPAPANQGRFPHTPTFSILLLTLKTPKSFHPNSSSSQEWCSTATLGLRKMSNLILVLNYTISSTAFLVLMLHCPKCEFLCPVWSYFTEINQPKSSFLPWRLEENCRCVMCERCRLRVGFSSSNSSGIKFIQNDLPAFCC